MMIHRPQRFRLEDLHAVHHAQPLDLVLRQIAVRRVEFALLQPQRSARRFQHHAEFH
jgi:hypothetical protein